MNSAPLDAMNLWIRRFQSRILIGEFLQRAANALAVFLFVFGTIVLAVRLAAPWMWPHVLWLALGAVPVSIGVWCVAQRQQQSRRETLAMLDQRLNAGGLLMTLDERPDQEWSEQLPQLQSLWRNAIPRVAPKRFASYIATPLLFSVAACFVPLREVQATQVAPQAVAQSATQQLDELKESLAKEELLEEEEQKQIEDAVEKLQNESSQTPLTHENWETVDALREKMQLRVDEATARTSKSMEALEQLTSANEGENQSLTAEEREQLEKDAEEAIEEFVKKNQAEKKVGAGKQGKPQSALAEKLQKLMKNGRAKLPGDPQERKELLEQLKQELEKEKQKLSELRSKCKSCGKCNGAGEKEGECEGEGQCQTSANSQRPGKGGINRGRGDAEMTWGDEASDKGVQFKEIALPPGFSDNPKDEIAEIKFIAPNDEPAAAVTKGTARSMDASSGDASWNRRLSPRHRNVVRKYFDGK